MIDCVASGTTKAVTVTWLFDGSPVENTEERKVLSNNTLLIKTLRHLYKGRYVCEAKIEGGPSNSAVVKVEIAGETRETVITGLNVNLMSSTGYIIQQLPQKGWVLVSILR